MGNNNVIIIVVVLLGILLVAIMSLLVQGNVLNSLTIERGNDEKIEITDIEKKRLLSDNLINIAQETEENLELCGIDSEISLQYGDIELTNNELNKCFTILDDQEKKINRLDSNTLSISEKRELEAIRLEFKVAKESLHLTQQFINMMGEIEYMTQKDLKRGITDFTNSMEGLIFKYERSLKEYEDTKFYREYVNTQDNIESLGYYKGQLDFLQKITEQL